MHKSTPTHPCATCYCARDTSQLTQSNCSLAAVTACHRMLLHPTACYCTLLHRSRDLGVELCDAHPQSISLCRPLHRLLKHLHRLDLLSTRDQSSRHCHVTSQAANVQRSGANNNNVHTGQGHATGGNSQGWEWVGKGGARADPWRAGGPGAECGVRVWEGHM